MDLITSTDQLRAILGGGETRSTGGFDRGGFYLAYFDYIMADAAAADQAGNAARATVDRAAARQILLQAEISTYSGFAGGAALVGNALAKHANPTIYPATLDIFSYDIANNLLVQIADRTANGPIAILTDVDIQNLDSLLWASFGLGDYFPGNVQFAGRDVNLLLSAGSLASTLSALQLTLGERVGYRAIDAIQKGGVLDTSNQFYDVVSDRLRMVVAARRGMI